MKNQYKIIFFCLISGLIIACEDENNIQFPASLKVVHAAENAPALHVNYFGREIIFSDNPMLSFGGSMRTSLPSDIERTIFFVSAEDTLNQVHQQSVTFQPGDIHTLFLTGDEENIEGTLVRDEPLVLMDSLVGIRFVNLSPDSGPVSVGLTGQTELISSDLAFKASSDFNQLTADNATGVYTFEFKDADGEVLINTTIDPVSNGFVFKNTTFVLMGNRADATLIIRRIDSF
ncbi:DUF4397 domain-containing protein [Fulvivirga sp. M361]|uniref:DUF4397 domain-containing protein n=1 Tax=Fulvivirga sp. M361 TaxID=2594266 RepID=UPI00162439A4|nr:DUF4397 domain-containing protein [Fulvivirga sp. M361]